MPPYNANMTDILPRIRAAATSPSTPQLNRLKARTLSYQKLVPVLGPEWESKTLEEVAGLLNQQMDHNGLPG